MKRIYSSILGVAQGSVSLFSDFENNGEMWVGSGPRTRTTSVKFSEPYVEVPSVLVTLEMFDMDHRANQRAEIVAENVTLTGFDIVFRTWGDSRVARARASWLAFGDAKALDDWELY